MSDCATVVVMVQREMEAKMMRSGLNVVWKMGKLLLEERVRRVCVIMMSAVDSNRSRVEALAGGLLQVFAMLVILTLSENSTLFDLHAISSNYPHNEIVEITVLFSSIFEPTRFFIFILMIN